MVSLTYTLVLISSLFRLTKIFSSLDYYNSCIDVFLHSISVIKHVFSFTIVVLYQQYSNIDYLNNISTSFYVYFIYVTSCLNLLMNLTIFIFIAASIPLLVSSLFINPKMFFSKYGISSEILSNLEDIEPNQKSIGAECIICTEIIADKDRIITLKCSHTYHSKCIKDWFISKFSCPLCRSIDLF